MGNVASQNERGMLSEEQSPVWLARNAPELLVVAYWPVRMDRGTVINIFISVVLLWLQAKVLLA